jgi:3-oxoacyl-[acyl-carrier-protein] synthase II
VAITGLGCVSSLGGSAAPFAEALVAGRTGFRELTEYAAYALRSRRGACIAGFDPAAVIPPLKLRRIDPVGRITIGAGLAALEQAGLPRRPEGYDDVGVSLGSFTAGVHASAEYLQAYLHQGPAAAPALLFSNTVGNAPASICALELALRGPNATLMHKEASGLAAIAFGAHLVRRGKSPLILAGGADVLETSFYRVHDWFGVLAPDPEPCRPYDVHRRGFLLGEAAALVVLEDAGHAAARGARVLGTILGTASSGSSEALNAWPARPEPIAQGIRQALARAEVAPEAIDVVYAAANGSPAFDAVEGAALRAVFGDRPVAVTAIKGAVGESGAAGAVSLAAALLLAGRQVVPPTAGLTRPAPDAPAGISPAAQPLRGPLALITSVGSGGTHVAVVVRASG